MKSRDEVMTILRQARHDLQARFPITRIALFGSYARGDQHEESDVDILVDVDPSIGLKFVSLAEELERLLGEPVELVSSRAVGPRTKPVLDFLRHVQRHLHRPIVLFWDGGSIHRRRLVKECPASGRMRLYVCRFPAYAPELNPAEYVWTHGKRCLANGTTHDNDELSKDLRTALGRIGRSQHLLKACLRMSDLSF